MDPAAGSTVSAATASVAAMRSARTLGRAPFWTAISPAVTPPAPRMVASHRAAVAAAADMCTDCRSQGGPAAGMAIGGYIQLLRTIEAATMIRIELTIPAPASRVSTRARRGLDVTTPDPGTSTSLL